ncbi:unnamed protein product [Clonostachys byssicola]|uniref:Terpene synthase n=1 Tax=Clonostachys byssicola TaxID=160290 RepID=A0A9N9U9M2_9HYPO|nr:unnamed protein product [Clonostachys byssicola]
MLRDILARWYPFAEWNKLRAVALFCVWLFVWDDEIDMSEGQFHGDFEKAQANFQSTLEFTRWALGLDSSESQQPDEEVGEGIPCSTITRGLFGAFGALFRQDAAQETKERLYREIEFYIGQVAKEHGVNIRRQILSTDDYLDIRLGTSGSYTLTAFLDYTTSTSIPSFIMESEEMKSLRYEENIMTILINDIYSLKKEMVPKFPSRMPFSLRVNSLQKYGVLTSMLPIEYNASDHKDLSRIMNQTMTRMEQSSKAFDEAAKELKKMARSGRYDDDTIVEGLSSWIANSRTLLTGCLEYHLKTKRYSMDSYLQSDGTVNLTL